MTSIILQYQISNVPDLGPQGQVGWRLVLSVAEAIGIDPNIFIYQREVTTAGETYTDTFKTVASVADIADLPSAPADEESFYRDEQLDMIFRSQPEMEEGLATILRMVEFLERANDLAQNLGQVIIAGFPATNLHLYWGSSTKTTLGNSDIQGFNSIADNSSRVFSEVFNLAGPAYLYVAWRAELGDATFTLNTQEVAMTEVTQAFTNSNGYTHSFRVFRTTATQSGLNLTLTSVPTGASSPFTP